MCCPRLLRRFRGGSLPAIVAEPGSMQMPESYDKEHPVSGQQTPPDKPTPIKIDRTAAALRQLYGRISAEPLPRRLVELLNRFKLFH